MKFFDYLDSQLIEAGENKAAVQLPLAQLGWGVRIPDPAPLDDYRPQHIYLQITYQLEGHELLYLGLETPGEFYPWEHRISKRFITDMEARLRDLDVEGLDMYVILLS